MSLVGGGQARARFSLEAEGDFVEAAVASASVAFSGLTILPPQQPLASGSWVGVGGGLVIPGSIAPALRALRSRGGVSVSSGLTDLASLSFTAPFMGSGGGRGVGDFGGVGGGGEEVGWRPSTDANNIGKSRSIHLVLVKNTSSKICFGCIGTDERRFCRSPQCTTKAHKKTRFDMGCNAGYFIATRRSSSLIAAFRAPFLDAAKLTEEVRAIVEDQGPDGERTTRQWEEFMVEAKVAWRVLEEERDRRQAGGIIREGSDEDGETKDQVLDLPDTPSEYEWEDSISIEEVTFKAEEMEDEEAPAITELRQVVQELSQKLKLMAKASRLDALGSMDYLWKSIARLGAALELSNKSVCFVREELGDISELHAEHGVYDVCEGVALALTSKPWEEELSALGDRVSEVGKLLSEVDEDHQATGRLLLKKIASAAPTPSPGTGPPLITSMVICDEQGNPCCTLGDLLQDHRLLRTEHSTLKADFDSLSAAVTAQGGQVLDGLGFASEAMVRILVMKECPKGDAFEVFLDVTSLFCCDSTYSPVSGWEKSTRGMEDDFSPSARKVVASYAQSHCAWYTDGKPVVAGKLLAAFKDADRWNGVGGMDGRRNEIETSAATSAEIARGYISDKLPKAGKLAPLALKMVDRTVEWVHTVHKHLDMELTRLTQLHISEEESLILLSEEVIIMYSRIHDVRKHMMEFTGQINKVDYMVRCIWVTLQVHQVMQEFVQGGLKSHPAIGSAFIRFLTKQTGNNVALGIGVQLEKLTTAVDRIESLAKMADTAAKDAARVSKKANARAATANLTAKKASEGLKMLYTKNSTLKH